MNNILKSENPHKRDKNIKYNAKSHVYTMNNQHKYISVTALVDTIFPFPKHPSEELKLQLKKGTILHSDIEYYYKTGISRSRDIEYNYFLNFVRENRNLEPYRSEWSIYDEDIFLSGTLDMIYKNNDGTYSIYDWKRSKNIIGQQLEKYTIQLNLYMLILENKYGIKIDKLIILSLHPDNENYKVINIKKIDLYPILRKLRELNNKTRRSNSRDSEGSRINSQNGNIFRSDGTRRLKRKRSNDYNDYNSEFIEDILLKLNFKRSSIKRYTDKIFSKFKTINDIRYAIKKSFIQDDTQHSSDSDLSIPKHKSKSPSQNSESTFDSEKTELF